MHYIMQCIGQHGAPMQMFIKKIIQKYKNRHLRLTNRNDLHRQFDVDTPKRDVIIIIITSTAEAIQIENGIETCVCVTYNTQHTIFFS